MKDLVVGLVVWATIVAAILVIAPNSHFIAPKSQTGVYQRFRPTAGDLLRVHDQQIVNSMILTSEKDAR
jgi:hypothetical protein